MFPQPSVPFDVAQFLFAFLDGAMLYMVHYNSEVKGQSAHNVHTCTCTCTMYVPVFSHLFVHLCTYGTVYVYVHCTCTCTCTRTVHVYIYRIAGIFRGRKLSRIGVKEDFAEKTFAQGTPRATCMRGCGLNLSPHPQ